MVFANIDKFLLSILLILSAQRDSVTRSAKSDFFQYRKVTPGNLLKNIFDFGFDSMEIFEEHSTVQ